MWPSEDLASRLYDLANWGLVIGLVIGVVSTAVVVWMGNVKEAYLRRQVATLNQSAASANERTANLEKESAALLKQLIEQGPRSHLLYGERQERLIEQLRPFSGQKVEIRHCASSFNQYFVDNDTIGVAMRLSDILGKSGWSVTPFIRENCNGTGLSVSINRQASASTRKAADALLSGLLAVPLAVVGNKVFIAESPRPEQPPMFEANGKEIVLSPLVPDTIVVTVLAHPERVLQARLPPAPKGGL